MRSRTARPRRRRAAPADPRRASSGHHADPEHRPQHDDVDPGLAGPLHQLGDEQALEQLERRLHPREPMEELVDRIVELREVLLGRRRGSGLRRTLELAAAIAASRLRCDSASCARSLTGRTASVYSLAALSWPASKLGRRFGAVRGQLVARTRGTCRTPVAIRRLAVANSCFASASPRIAASTIDRRRCSSAALASRSSCSTFSQALLRPGVLGVGPLIAAGPGAFDLGLAGRALGDQAEDIPQGRAFATQEFGLGEVLAASRDDFGTARSGKDVVMLTAARSGRNSRGGPGRGSRPWT